MLSVMSYNATYDKPGIMEGHSHQIRKAYTLEF